MSNPLALIIEDNVELGYIYAASLETLNFDIEHIEDGKDALDRLDSDNIPRLIILDMNLPRVSGHYIYKRIRSDERYAETPVIIATANTLIAEALQSEIIGIDRLLVKPVSPSQLRKVVQEMINTEQ